jgi:hypothetical protein
MSLKKLDCMPDFLFQNIGKIKTGAKLKDPMYFEA